MTDAEVKIFFKDHFQHIPDDMTQRDFGYERETILEGEAEFRLFSTLFTGSYKRWLPAFQENSQGHLEGAFKYNNAESEVFARLGGRNFRWGARYFRGEKSSTAVDFYIIRQPLQIYYRKFDCHFLIQCFFPLLHIFCFFQRMVKSKALGQIAEQYQDDVDYLLKKHDVKIVPIEQESSLSSSLDTFMFCEQNKATIAYVTKEKVKKKKAFLPYANVGFMQGNLSVEMGIATFPNPAPLYRPSFFHYQYRKYPDNILLTDSLEIALANCLYWGGNRVKDFECVSWYGDQAGIAKADWTPLQDKNIYYLLIEHSGFGTRAVYETARAAYEKLKQVGVRKIKYVSYFHSNTLNDTPSRIFTGDPVILDEEEFLKLATAVYPKHRLIKKRNSKIALPLLFYPIIREQSVTMLFGRPGCGKTWATLSVAYAISQGATLSEGWNAKPPANVLYVHAGGDESPLDQKLMTMLKMQVGNQPNVIRYHELPALSAHEASPFPQYPGFRYDDTRPSLDDHDKAALATIKHNRFFWWSIDKNELDVTNHGGQLRLLKELDRITRPQQNQDCHDSPKASLLVLDGLTSLNKLCRPNKEVLESITHLFKVLKGRGCAVVMVLPGTKRNRASFVPMERIGLDNIIEIENAEPANAVELAISVLFHKLTPNPKKKFCRGITLEFSPDAAQPGWAFFPKLYSPKEIRRRIKKLHKDFNCRQIADILNANCKDKVSHDTVRKIVVELKLSKKRSESPLKKTTGLLESLQQPPTQNVEATAASKMQSQP
jgi:hypothetical protein